MEMQDTGWEDVGGKNDRGGDINLLDDFDLEGDSQDALGESTGGGNMQDEDSLGKELSLYDNDEGSNSSMSDKLASDSGSSSKKTSETLQQLYFSSVKEGMATCEHCGNVGIKHAFYSKSKRFCSMACSKAFSSAQKKMTGPKKKTPPKAKPVVQMPQVKTVYRKFDWGEYLTENQAAAAPVSSFKHAQLSSLWSNITEGMKVEIPNNDVDLPTKVYWIAAVVKIAGYRMLMRYEGYGGDPSHDFWTNLTTGDVHHVGWCASTGHQLVPPKTIEHKYEDWKEFLVKRLTGARTLPQAFHTKLEDSLNTSPICKGMMVEVVDKMCVSAMRVAKIGEIFGGRLKLQYTDSHIEMDQFWCHMHSALLHPVGWSQMVGHKLRASQEYKTSSLNKAVLQKYTDEDCTPDMFPLVDDVSSDSGLFQAGMKLEAIDPLNLSAICVATVMKVLRNNYLMIGIDGSMAENGADWFCYHATSPCIFPVGFCEINNLPLTPPKGHKGTFRWLDYLKQTKSVAAPVKLFRQEIPKHGFKLGMKIEAVDLMEPRLICVATVAKVVGRLLRIHFDGWESNYDQWIDCCSPDIYPVGWCEMVSYPLEGPKMESAVVESPTLPQPALPKKRPGKPKVFNKGNRKKKRPRLSTDQDKSRDGEMGSDGDDGEWDSSQSQDASLSSQGVQSPLERGDGAKTTTSISSKYSNIQSALQRSASGTSPWQQAGGFTVSSPPQGSQKTKPEQLTMLKSDASQKPTIVGSLPNSVYHIPRLLPLDSDDADSSGLTTNDKRPVVPTRWGITEVCHFLRINGCSAFCESFARKEIDGAKLLSLTKEQIANLMGMKVGPSLRIYNLVQSLGKLATQPAQPAL